MIVSDTGMWDENTPTVCTGMRGLAECEIELYGPERDIHSGSFGGAVPNPATEVARLVAALHDERGRVTVPGFYDHVAELTDAERALFAALPFDEAAWLRTAKSTAARGEDGYSTLERVWARPTAEVNGIGGGYQGDGSKTVIPASALVKISFRLVDGQDPDRVEKLVRTWAESRIPAGIRHRITFAPATRPCLTPLDHPALQALARAMGRAFGKEILFTREGAPAPPPTSGTYSTPPSSSSASPYRPTAGTHPTRRSSSPSSSRAWRRPPTSGVSWPPLSAETTEHPTRPGGVGSKAL